MISQIGNTTRHPCPNQEIRILSQMTMKQCHHETSSLFDSPQLFPEKEVAKELTRNSHLNGKCNNEQLISQFDGKMIQVAVTTTSYLNSRHHIFYCLPQIPLPSLSRGDQLHFLVQTQSLRHHPQQVAQSQF